MVQNVSMIMVQDQIRSLFILFFAYNLDFLSILHCFFVFVFIFILIFFWFISFRFVFFCFVSFFFLFFSLLLFIFFILFLQQIPTLTFGNLTTFRNYAQANSAFPNFAKTHNCFLY